MRVGWSAVTALIVISTIGFLLKMDYDRGYLQTGYGLLPRRRKSRR